MDNGAPADLLKRLVREHSKIDGDDGDLGEAYGRNVRDLSDPGVLA